MRQIRLDMAKCLMVVPGIVFFFFFFFLFSEMPIMFHHSFVYIVYNAVTSSSIFQIKIYIYISSKQSELT